MALIIELLVFCALAFVMPYVLSEIHWGELGVFFGWQIGAVVQTVFSYRRFAKDNQVPSISFGKKLNINRLVYGVMTLIIFQFGIYKYIAYGCQKEFCHSVWFITWGESVTFFPMLLFFVLNWWVYCSIGRESTGHDNWSKEYRTRLKNIMLLIDMPCLVPFVIVLTFGVLFHERFELEPFLRAVGSVLLLISNILTIVLNNRVQATINDPASQSIDAG